MRGVRATGAAPVDDMRVKLGAPAVRRAFGLRPVSRRLGLEQRCVPLERFGRRPACARAVSVQWSLPVSGM